MTNEIEKLDLIVKMKFGSHLYGTNTPESDTDYKGIFMPTKEQILLGKIPKSISYSPKKTEEGLKNSKDDVDFEIYSIHYFLKLACEGQTVALDMLHAPRNMIEVTSVIWKDLVKKRELFYTKNLNAFVGYARKQAAKYGIKGSRLNAIKNVIDYLTTWNSDLKLKDIVLTAKGHITIWSGIPTGEHIHDYEDTPDGIKQKQICGRIIQETQTVGYTLDILNRIYDNYGKRAQQAANNKGIDFKAISHALRAAFEVKEILTQGTITFPLKEANFLRQIKAGKINYTTGAAPALEFLMDEIEELAKNSSLPEKVNRKYWNKWLVNTIEREWFLYNHFNNFKEGI